MFGKQAIAVLEKAHAEARLQNSYLKGRLDQARKNGDKVVVVIDDDEDDLEEEEVRRQVSGPSKRKNLGASGSIISFLACKNSVTSLLTLPYTP